jgi:demethylmenaquinone methyltransferase/2-methoxy-6-polyprenyl-1,4-benzoquinol methylase
MPDPTAVNDMFGRIAPRYDLANRVLSLGIDRWWRWHQVRGVVRRCPITVVDLATGSGDVAFALAGQLPPDAQVIGLDFCQPMLDQANRRKKRFKGSSRDPGTFIFWNSPDPKPGSAPSTASISTTFCPISLGG